jgi:integrase
MPKQPPNHVRYSSGIIKPARNKGKRGYDVYLRANGKDHRTRKLTLPECKAWIIDTELAVGSNTAPLTAAQMSDARHAIGLLPAGFTLTEAARAFRDGAEPTETPPMALDDAVAAYLASRKAFVAPDTLRGYSSSLARLCAFVGPVSVAGVKREHIEGFLSGMGQVTRNGNLRNLSAFWTWAVESGMVPASPAAQVERARVVDAEIHVLTMAQAAALIHVAASVRPRMVPYFALALFAGIRPEELARLPVAKIGKEYVVIDGAIAKKKRRRTVPIRANLRAWLDLYRPDGPLIHFSRRDFRAVVEASGIEWHNDACRHTFASMAYSVRPDAVEIAGEMGNSPTVFYEHYRALAAPGEGARYFGLWPDRCMI